MPSIRWALVIWTVFLAAFSSIASAQGIWQSLGPDGIGWVSDVAVADSKAYAATRNGVFRSDDGGATWAPGGLTGEPIDRIVTRSGAPATFARSYRGYGAAFGLLYVTRDGGETWTPVDLRPVLAVALDPESASVVYAATDNGRLAKSTDAGTTWEFPSNLPGDGYGWSLAFGSSAIYVLTGSGVFKSADHGASWAGVAQPSPHVTGLFNGKGGVLYALGDPGIFCRSADGASSWTCSAFAGYLSSAERILELPGENGASPLLLAILSDGLFSSRDGGATWTRTRETTTRDVTAPHGLASDDSGSLVLAGSEQGILRSSDRGETWTPFGAGLRAEWIDSLASDPQDASRIWAGGVGGLFRTTDRGLSWSVVDPAGFSRVGAIAVDPTRPSTVYVAGNTVYRTEDGGATWSPSASLPGFVNTLTIDPGSPQTVWATSGDLYKSEDGARTWHLAGSISQYIQSILFDQKGTGKVYAGGFFGFVDYGGYDYPYGGSIFVSYDRGATFAKNGMDLGSAVIAIVQDPHEDMVYAATYEAIFRSGDGGKTWQATNTSPPRFIETLVADPKRPGQVYAGTTDGVYRTLDGGTTWALLSEGLAHSPVTKLAISPDGATLLAGTAGGGVFELDLASRPPSFPCTPSATRLCLVGSRYAVELTATRKDVNGTGAAAPLGDRSGYFGLPFATGDPTLPEVVVKMLADGAFGASGAPIFYSSLTTLPYVLTVTDTVTGRVQTYASNPDAPLCGGTDLPFGQTGASMSPLSAPAADAEPALQLLGGRFSVTLEARHPRSGQIVNGVTISSGDVYGIFSLPGITGDPQFPEVIVKMVDARSFTGKFWFFHTGLTNIDYTLTVTDSVTGAVRTYVGTTPFCGTADTSAFMDSPSNPSPIDINGFWTGSVSFPSDCYTCRSPEETRVTLSQVGKTVTGHFSTECLGDRELIGTLDGDQLTIDFNSGNGRFTGTVSSTTIHVEKNCDYWGYGDDHTMQLDLSR